jgi:hypothetical protein
MQILVRLVFVFVGAALLLMSLVVWVAIQVLRMLADIEGGSSEHPAGETEAVSTLSGKSRALE